MKAVETAGAESALDRVLAEPELQELSPGHHAVLPPGERRDLAVRVN
jgi:hypothetical protein